MKNNKKELKEVEADVWEVSNTGESRTQITFSLYAVIWNGKKMVRSKDKAAFIKAMMKKLRSLDRVVLKVKI